MASTFDNAQADNATGNAGGSTFDRALASMPAAKQAESAIANVYAAYNDGRMSPEQSQAFEADVQGGKVLLPKGAKLKTNAPPAAPVADAARNVYDAYATGKMNAEQAAAYETDVRAGAMPLPPGAKLKEGPGLIQRAKDLVTGNDRETRATRELPELPGSDVLRDAGMSPANAFRLASVLLLTPNEEEAAQLIRAASPDLAIAQDEKGNLIVANNKTGKQAVLNKPGLSEMDALQTGVLGAAFTPAGRAGSVVGAGVKAAVSQAGIETAQAATGGEFNAADIAIAGGVGAAAPVLGKAVDALAAKTAPAVNRVLGRAETGTPAAGVRPGVEPAMTPSSPAAPVVAPAAPAAPAAPVRAAVPPAATPVEQMSTADLAQTTKKAAEGNSKAHRTLVEQSAPDADTVAAAKRLGVEDYLQPDHVTTSQAFREVVQAVKSEPGSALRAQEIENLPQIAKRADDLIEEIGGTTDLSTLDASVRGRLQATQAALETKADDLYAQLRAKIPQKAEAPAQNTLAFIAQRADELGGAANLSSAERVILRKLAPKAEGGVPAESWKDFTAARMGEYMRSEGGHAGAMTRLSAEWNAAKSAASGELKQPTYALLDDVRKDLGAAAMARGPFKDADSGLAKKLYGLLSDDQAAVVAKHGMSDVFDAARGAVKVRKALEDDMKALFGKEVDGSLVRGLSEAVKVLPAGDATKLAKLVALIPAEMRQEVVASGLNTAFGKSAQRGSLNFGTFAKWWEGVQTNKQAAAALFSNLPPEARQQLADLARVSQGIAASSRERITTGRLVVAQQVFERADSLMANIYARAKQAAVGAAAGKAAEPALAAVGLPGAGVAAGIASALARGKPQAIKAADALIASSAFREATKAAAQGGTATKVAAAKVARSKEFAQFLRALGNPREMKDREAWVLRAMEAENNRKAN